MHSRQRVSCGATAGWRNASTATLAREQANSSIRFKADTFYADASEQQAVAATQLVRVYHVTQLPPSTLCFKQTARVQAS